MTRALTTKEKLTFVFLAIVVVVALWYLLFYLPTTADIENLKVEQEQIKGETALLQEEVMQYRKWSDELGLDMGNQTDDFQKIADYNNVRELTAELNKILGASTSYSMSFAPLSTPEEQGKNCYRRDVSLNFTTNTYEQARAIVQKLNDSEFGCLIQNMSLSQGTTSDGAAAINGTMTISFFEYAEMKAVPAGEADEAPAA